MSYYREEPFNVSREGQGDWIVDFEGKPVHVDSHADAVLLADLPVQLHRMVSGDQRACHERTERILTLCDEYHLGRFRAVRELKSRFKRTKVTIEKGESAQHRETDIGDGLPYIRYDR